MYSLLNKNLKKRATGFTLLELIIVIVLLGVIGTGITSFIRLATQTYVSVSARDELVSSARFVVERLNREIRNALPNSVRVKTGSLAGFDVQCLEFVPIVASTTYTDIPVAPDALSDKLTVVKFNGADGNNYQCTGSCLDAVAVYPLNSNDIYADHGAESGKVFGLKSVDYTTPSTDEWTLTLDRTTGVLFDDESPTKRVYIVRAPVSYCVAANSIFRYENYAYTSSQVTPPLVANVLMAENIINMNTLDLPFVLSNATLQRNALVNMKLHFSRDNENIVFNNEVHIANVP